MITRNIVNYSYQTKVIFIKRKQVDDQRTHEKMFLNKIITTDITLKINLKIKSDIKVTCVYFIYIVS